MNPEVAERSQIRLLPQFQQRTRTGSFRPGRLTMTAPLPGSGPELADAALVSWLLTEGLGAYMLTSWIGTGGARARASASGGALRSVIFGHAGLAFTGFVFWVAFTISGQALAMSTIALAVLGAVTAGK
jgi:hypothetical protein